MAQIYHRPYQHLNQPTRLTDVVLSLIQASFIRWNECRTRTSLDAVPSDHRSPCRDEITETNIHESHLCCKPITSVKNLSTNDQKKLIEHDYLTLISLLPLYLGSQNNFQTKIREQTNISHDAAAELERLMSEWGSARLFIGANSHYKTLTQTI